MTERTMVFTMPTGIRGELKCTEGTRAGERFELSAGTFVIGRDASADLSLPVEPGVSGLHAKIIAEGDAYVLVDNESRNGTLVNGQPVQRTILYSGDNIRVAGCALDFRCIGGPERPAAGTAPPQPGVQQPAVRQVHFEPTEAAPVAQAAIEAAHAAQAPAKKGGLFGWLAAGVVLTMLLGGGGIAALVLLDTPDGPLPTPTPAGEAAGKAKPATAGAGQATAASAQPAKPGTPAPSTDKPATTAGAAEPGAVANAGTGAADPGTASGTASGTAEPGVGTADATETPDEAGAGPTWVPTEIATGSAAAVRAMGAGKIKVVSVKAGDKVKRGQVLVELEGIAMAREVATLKLEVKTLKQIVETQGGDEAKSMLAEEQARLKALQRKLRSARIVAPATGTVKTLNVVAGERVRLRQVIGTIAKSSKTAGVRFTLPTGAKRVKRGDTITVETKDKTPLKAKVTGVVKLSAGEQVVTASVGKNAAQVVRAQVP